MILTGDEVGRDAKARPPGPAWYRDLLSAWSRSLRRRGRAPGTIRTYRWALNDFGAWLAHCRIEHVDHLLVEVVYSWQDDLIERGMGPSSRMVAASAVRGLLRWAAREGLGVASSLWERVEPVSVPEKAPRPLEPAHRDRILEHFARRRRGLEQLRDRALFLFLLTTGSRITAVLSMNRDQVDSGGPLVVIQKGGREHTLVPSAKARAWLDDYLRARGRDDQPALWVKVGPRGRHRLDDRATNAIWAALADELRIPRFTSHVVKHTAVTELGELTESDTEVSRHVGWKGTAMMPRYRQLRAERRQALVDRLDNLVPPAPVEPPGRRSPRIRVIRGKQ